MEKNRNENNRKNPLNKSFGYAFEGIRTGIRKERNMNTALEAVVDLVTKEKKPLAKIAKDTAAGAVLVSAIAAAIIGCIIFVPYLLELIKSKR